MNIKDAKHYIHISVKEGYMSEEEAIRLLSLPEEEMITEVEELGARGDFEAQRQD